MNRRTAFSPSQFAEADIYMTRALPKALTGRDPVAVLNALGTNGDRLARMLGADIDALLLPTIEEQPGVHDDGDWSPESWARFYRSRYSEQFDNAGGEEAIPLSIFPDYQPGFGWPILALQGVTDNVAYAACERDFRCWRYASDLDADIVLNGRTSATTYGIRVRDRVEADEEHQNLSGNDLAVRGVKGITLRERMLLEHKYWCDTQKHLDLENWTLCSGSRRAGGSLPDARWYDGRFGVGSRDPSYRDPELRVREVLC